MVKSIKKIVTCISNQDTDKLIDMHVNCKYWDSKMKGININHLQEFLCEIDDA